MTRMIVGIYIVLAHSCQEGFMPCPVKKSKTVGGHGTGSVDAAGTSHREYR